MALSADFAETFRQASGGFEPYEFQECLAASGLPELLCVPTGAGKTSAAVLPWLWRRLGHPDADVRRETPGRLVFVLPQRALVEQAHREVARYLERLGLNQRVGLFLLLGGTSRDDTALFTAPDHTAVLIGTQDMVLSRLLCRGYGDSRSIYPMSFGLLHSGSQFVFDEVQLFGPGLPTSLQLEGLRRRFGTAVASRSMWMSATVDETELRTIDFAGPTSVVTLGEGDRAGALRRVLDATRLIEHGLTSGDAKKYAKEIAEIALSRHRPGTRTLIVANTVDRAVKIFQALRHAEADTVLLHSRFRPGERSRHTESALAKPGAAGTIVVATQVLEAGIDTTCDVLITEIAPWSSIVQRAGRCNRYGEAEDARIVWVEPPAGRAPAAPYEPFDIDQSREALLDLTGRSVTSTELMNRKVDRERPNHPVLRARDLIELFDTTPDMTGNETDVSKWIRDADEISCSVAWRVDVDSEGEITAPHRDELCQAPIASLRDAGKPGWCFDYAVNAWTSLTKTRIRPGGVYILDAAAGGYDPVLGWSPNSTTVVEPVRPTSVDHVDGMGSDALSGVGTRVTLSRHLTDVRREVEVMFTEAPTELPEPLRQAAASAGLHHDLGKAHPVFQASLAAVDAGCAVGGPWAKSSSPARLAHSRPYFRHELVSALMLLQEPELLAGAREAELITYLVAAHHGKVRVSVRPMPEETGTVLGVGHPEDGSTTVFTLDDGRAVPAITPVLDRFRFGRDSWTTMVSRLIERPDLGVFRLAFLEAVVRAADWRVSRRYREEADA